MGLNQQKLIETCHDRITTKKGSKRTKKEPKKNPKKIKNRQKNPKRDLKGAKQEPQKGQKSIQKGRKKDPKKTRKVHSSYLNKTRIETIKGSKSSTRITMNSNTTKMEHKEPKMNKRSQKVEPQIV